MEVEDFRRGFQDVFLPALDKALDSPADFHQTCVAIRAQADRLIERYRHDWPSNRDPYNLEFTAFLIATWRVLRPSRTDEEIRRKLETSLAHGFGWMTGKVSAGLDGSNDPFQTLVAISKEREANFFGDGFAFERTIDGADAYHLHVTHCWFVSVCRAEGAMGIAPSFCAFDAIWFDAIDPVRHEARFTRPTVIAEGSDRCRFHIDRT